MTLAHRMWDPFGIENWFRNTTYQFTNEGKAQIENYRIYELPDGRFRILLEYEGSQGFLREDMSIRESLEEAKEYVEKQVAYYKQKTAKPTLVWSGKDEV